MLFSTKKERKEKFLWKILLLPMSRRYLISCFNSCFIYSKNVDKKWTNEDVMWTNEDKIFHKRGRIVDERGRCALTCPRNAGIIAVEIKSERKC